MTEHRPALTDTRCTLAPCQGPAKCFLNEDASSANSLEACVTVKSPYRIPRRAGRNLGSGPVPSREAALDPGARSLPRWPLCPPSSLSLGQCPPEPVTVLCRPQTSKHIIGGAVPSQAPQKVRSDVSSSSSQARASEVDGSVPHYFILFYLFYFLL